MKNVSKKLVTLFILVTMLISTFGQTAFAKNSTNLVQSQKDMLKRTLQSINVGEGETSAKLYDSQGFDLYSKAYDNVKATYQATYEDITKTIDQDCDEEFKNLLKDYKNILDSDNKLPKIEDLLTQAKSEIDVQYINTHYNRSDKLIDIKQSLTIYALVYIMSEKCSDETAEMFTNALKNFFTADKILVKNNLNELDKIMNESKDEKLKITTVNLQGKAQLMNKLADKHLNKGLSVPSSVEYRISFRQSLDALNLNGFVAKPDIGKYKLLIQASSGGTLITGTSGNYNEGEIINLSAIANQGYIFCGWKTSNGGVFKDEYSESTSFTMPANDTNIEVIFLQESNSITLNWKENSQSLISSFLAGTKLELEVDTDIDSNVVWHISNGDYSVISKNKIEWTTPKALGNYEVVVIAYLNNYAKKISRNISIYTQDDMDKFNNGLLEDKIYKSDNLLLVDSEDYDSDGLSNIDEKNQGMNPFSKDSDSDGLLDSDEINQYHTNPIICDTDSDGISDGIEVNKGLNPLSKSSNGIVNDGDLKYSEEIKNANSKLSISGSAEIVYHAALEFYDNEYIENMPGVASKIANVYTIDGRQDFESATLEFDYDQFVLMNKGILEDNLSIYYLNEATKELELIETSIDKVNKKATAKLTHFSKYLLADKSRVSNNIGKCDIVFVIDNSGSMFSNDASDQRLDVVNDFVNGVTGDFRFGLVKFTSQAKILSALTNSKDDINNQINTMRGTAYGGTAIGVAINSALPLYNDNSVKKIMILLTDGEDYDTTTINNAVQSAKAQNVQIFTIGLGSGVNENLLKNTISIPTGGYYYSVNNANLLKSTFSDISSNISITTNIVVSGKTIKGNELANSGFKALNDGYNFENIITNVSPVGTCHGFVMSSHLKYNKTLPLSKTSSGSGEDLKPAYNVANIAAYTTDKLYNLKIDQLRLAVDKNKMDNMKLSANGVDWIFDDKTTKWYADNGFTFIMKDHYQSPVLDINSTGFLGNNWTSEQRQAIYCILWWFNNQTGIFERIVNNLPTTRIDLTNKDNFQLLINKVKGGLPCLLSIRGNGVGHALVSERIIQSTSDPNTYYIEIYDCNYPGQSEYITAKRNKSWWGDSYSLSCDYPWAKDYSIYLYTI